MRYFYFILMLTISSCKYESEGKEWIANRDISLFTAGLKVVKHNKIFKGKEERIDLYLTNSNYLILNAYMFCNIDSFNCIDSTSLNIIGCNDNLYMKNDTVEIYYTPKVNSSNNPIWEYFPVITILFKNKMNNDLHIYNTVIHNTSKDGK